MQAARASLCFQPPDKAPANCEARELKPRRSNEGIDRIFAMWKFKQTGDKSRFWRIERSSYKTKSLRHIADLTFDLCRVFENV